MKKIFILTTLLPLLCVNSYANLGDFYLKSAKKPERLMPSTTMVRLAPHESFSVSVEVLPQGAACPITWQISSDVATLTQRGNYCTINAVHSGDAVLYARGGDLSCEISLKVAHAAPKIRLSSPSDTIKLGEEAIIRATPDTKSRIEWRVEGAAVHSSFGGNICKISPKEAGRITVFATADGETAKKTLIVLPSEGRGLNLSTLGAFLALGGVILLIIVFYYGSGYERKI